MLFYDEEDHLTELEITNASKRVSNFSLEADEGMNVFPYMSPVELGDFARNLRKRLNKSQAELAHYLAVHQSNIRRAEQDNVDLIREAGLGYYVWTVNNVDDAQEAIELGVDGITTDRPAWLKKQLLSRNGWRLLQRP